MTGGETEQLLAVPKVGRGTGQQQCDVCLRALEDWRLKPMVQGMVFDTASANTGLKASAGTLLEKALGRDMIFIGCRHHVSKFMLSAVCAACPGPASGPQLKMFKKFQEEWVVIDQCVTMKGIYLS